jgi:hypothetical protein
MAGMSGIGDPVVANAPGKVREPAFTSADEMFDICRHAADTFRAKRDDEPAKMFINGERMRGEKLAAALPSADDKDYREFADRLTTTLGMSTFLVYSYDLRRYSAAVEDRTSRFLDAAASRYDLPSGARVLELFMGQYKSTEGGIHREMCPVFHNVLGGNKAIRTWPTDTWPIDQHKMRFSTDESTANDEYYLLEVGVDERLDAAVTLRGGPGEVLYWPAGWWHVGISPELSISATLCVYPDAKYILRKARTPDISSGLGPTPLA